jgi:hypothetical protein
MTVIPVGLGARIHDAGGDKQQCSSPSVSQSVSHIIAGTERVGIVASGLRAPLILSKHRKPILETDALKRKTGVVKKYFRIFVTCEVTIME